MGTWAALTVPHLRGRNKCLKLVSHQFLTCKYYHLLYTLISKQYSPRCIIHHLPNFLAGINAVIDRATKSLLYWPAIAISVQSLLQTLIIEKALFSQCPSFPLGNLYVKRPINAGNLLCGQSVMQLRVRENWELSQVYVWNSHRALRWQVKFVAPLFICT